MMTTNNSNWCPIWRIVSCAAIFPGHAGVLWSDGVCSQGKLKSVETLVLNRQRKAELYSLSLLDCVRSQLSLESLLHCLKIVCFWAGGLTFTSVHSLTDKTERLILFIHLRGSNEEEHAWKYRRLWM